MRKINNKQTIATGGSLSLSLGTFFQSISIAPWSPGEHGIKRSLTIFDGSVGEGPVTYQNKTI